MTLIVPDWRAGLVCGRCDSLGPIMISGSGGSRGTARSFRGLRATLEIEKRRLGVFHIASPISPPLTGTL